MDPYDIEMVMEHAKILQIGARNMANFSLLRRVGEAIAGTEHGVVLKRGSRRRSRSGCSRPSTHHGGGRGQRSLVRTRNPHFRDEHAFHAGSLCGDRGQEADGFARDRRPSHAAGRRDLVVPLSKAAVAAEADGLMVDGEPPRASGGVV